MKYITRPAWYLGIILCATSSMVAETATMKLTDAGSNIMAGVYVNPYTATIDSTSMKVICDDLTDDSYIGEEWIADVYHLTDGAATLQNTQMGQKWGTTTGLLDNYYALAYLSVQLLSEANAHTAALISFAIWSIFEPTATTTWLNSHGASADVGAVTTLRNDALAAVAGGVAPNFDPANVTIYSYKSLISCPNGCAPPPQEFITVKTPEAPVLAMLAFDLTALAALILLVFRRRSLIQ
jgi:hypothetical protein